MHCVCKNVWPVTFCNRWSNRICTSTVNWKYHTYMYTWVTSFKITTIWQSKEELIKVMSLMEHSTVTVLIHTKYQTDWSYKMLKLVQMHTQNFVIAVQAGNRNSCSMYIDLKLYEFSLKCQWTNQEVCSHQKVQLHQGECVHITDVNTLPPPLISLLTMPPLITAYDNS